MTRLLAGTRDAAGRFRAVFGAPPDSVWSAPGRVNLLGEHTDYNAGLCLPMAIAFRAECAVRRDRSGLLRIASAQRPGMVVETPLDRLAPGAVAGWASYVAGAAWVLDRRPEGLQVLIDSDVPEGAGLSSSAALEVATLGALAAARGTELALLAQRVENEFVGVPSGLMDQLAASSSSAGHALLFDARSLQVSPVPLDLNGLSLLVVDTRASHELTDGGYARRREECRRAAELLGVRTLREASSWDGLPSPERERARHVITEIERVRQAASLLSAGRLPDVGPLMTASHLSLRDDFAVSVAELDVAVDVALAAGALGSRMTGGGFGGSTVSLTADPVAAAAAVEAAFRERGWDAPRWFVAEPADGAQPVDGRPPAVVRPVS